MAKVQGKKAAAARARTRETGSGAKATARAAAKRAVKRTSAAARPAKKAAKVVARKAVAKAKKAAKPVRKAAKAAKKAVKQTAKKAVKTAKAVAPKAAVASKVSVKKPAAVLPARPKPPVAPNVPAAPKPAADAKKARTRRPRPRIHSNGAPVAAWLPQGEKPRPSSFIPAPARAEAPSLIAAPPASSDRLIRPEDVTDFVTRTVPVRVDIEQGGGRVYIGVNPEEITLRAGEGVEWDFRYLNGSDVTVDEIVIEFEKPSPFSAATFRSHKPGTARPHRQLSGPAQKTASGKRLQYVIRAIDAFKTELSSRRPFVTIT